jgi:4-hydroxybenzoate polyprenyltransferase
MSSTVQPAPFFSLVPVALALAGGWQVFLAVLILLLLATIYSLYTRRGSGINQRPYANVYTSAPGAQGSSTLSHDESAARRYTRGTR